MMQALPLLQCWCFLFALVVSMGILMNDPYPSNIEKMVGPNLQWIPNLTTYVTVGAASVCIYKAWEAGAGGGGGGAY